MFKKLQPAAVVFEESVVNRKSRFKRIKDLLETSVSDIISERSTLGHFFGTVSFVDEDPYIDYDKRTVFIDEIAPVLKSLGYKLTYNDGINSRAVSIDWMDAKCPTDIKE